jgi:hypothetical protein
MIDRWFLALPCSSSSWPCYGLVLCRGAPLASRRAGELELELIQTHMTQKPWLCSSGCACGAQKVRVCWGGVGRRGCRVALVCVLSLRPHIHITTHPHGTVAQGGGHKKVYVDVWLARRVAPHVSPPLGCTWGLASQRTVALPPRRTRLVRSRRRARPLLWLRRRPARLLRWRSSWRWRPAPGRQLVQIGLWPTAGVTGK